MTRGRPQRQQAISELRKVFANISRLVTDPRYRQSTHPTDKLFVGAAFKVLPIMRKLRELCLEVVRLDNGTLKISPELEEVKRSVLREILCRYYSRQYHGLNTFADLKL